jgi:hypothetical protein
MQEHKTTKTTQHKQNKTKREQKKKKKKKKKKKLKGPFLEEAGRRSREVGQVDSAQTCEIVKLWVVHHVLESGPAVGLHQAPMGVTKRHNNSDKERQRESKRRRG